jgi:hypothetical protein
LSKEDRDGEGREGKGERGERRWGYRAKKIEHPNPSSKLEPGYPHKSHKRFGYFPIFFFTKKNLSTVVPNQHSTPTFLAKYFHNSILVSSQLFKLNDAHECSVITLVDSIR